MPKKYANKSNHNKHFLETIENNYPEDFFDWKVTVQFYTALHKCYCVIITKEKDVLPSHSKNIKNLKIIDASIAKKLFTLYKNSRQSRYDGFIKEEAMLRINKINYANGNVLLKGIEKEVAKYYPIPS